MSKRRLAQCLQEIVAEIKADKKTDRQLSQFKRKVATLERRVVALEMRNHLADEADDEEVPAKALLIAVKTKPKRYTTEDNVIYLSKLKRINQESKVS